MERIEFEWDETKNVANQKKHGVSFEDARTAFYDEHARLKPDPDHSGEEERFILLGYSSKADLLLISHCYRETAEKIRIISARPANRLETKQYHFFRGF